ncbi:uncharacterized protein [Anas acuta]|uniref:uncharacterized protein isoform X2 n=1 Tax=Anas acuta TaxID=28680 RepID=UPI0035C8A627
MNSAARNLIPAERIPCSQCSELVPDSARTCADPGPLLCQEIVFSCEMLQVLKTTQTALQEGVPKGVLSLPWWKKEGSGHFSGCPSAACGRVRVTEGAIAQRNDLKGAPLQLVGRLVVSGGLASGGAVADKLPREISPRCWDLQTGAWYPQTGCCVQEHWRCQVLCITRLLSGQQMQHANHGRWHKKEEEKGLQHQSFHGYTEMEGGTGRGKINLSLATIRSLLSWRIRQPSPLQSSLSV